MSCKYRVSHIVGIPTLKVSSSQVNYHKESYGNLQITEHQELLPGAILVAFVVFLSSFAGAKKFAMQAGSGGFQQCFISLTMFFVFSSASWRSFVSRDFNCFEMEVSTWQNCFEPRMAIRSEHSTSSWRWVSPISWVPSLGLCPRRLDSADTRKSYANVATGFQRHKLWGVNYVHGHWSLFMDVKRCDISPISDLGIRASVAEAGSTWKAMSFEADETWMGAWNFRSWFRIVWGMGIAHQARALDASGKKRRIGCRITYYTPENAWKWD